jgi:hypothetical protein
MVPDSSARLLGAIAPLIGQDRERLASLGRLVLAPHDAPCGATPGRSHLNHDGTPLQVCLGSASSGVSVRLLGDPGWRLPDAAARWDASREALASVLQATGSEELTALCHRSLAGSVTAELSSYVRGVMWLAAGLDGGTALYVDARPWGARAPAAALRWARGVVADPEPLGRALACLSDRVRVASVGVEGTHERHARAKVYLRLTRPIRLDQSGVPLLEHPALSAFLAALVGLRRPRLGGLVVSLGYSARTGAPVDAKLDLCGHCLPREPHRWQQLLDALSARFELPAVPVLPLLESGVAEVAFVGLGVDTAGAVRLNVYLKPVDGLPQASGRAAARQALTAGVGGLLGLQEPSGRISDYQLPVGPADGWVTGFAGVALATSAAIPGAREGAARAARWLEQSRPYPAGHGYNARTGPDADSTGFALRLSGLLGQPAASADRAFLDQQWIGGFRTYPRADAWGAAHPCVTAAAALAWTDCELEARREELISAIERARSQDGTWPGYWWRRPTYATWHHLRLRQRLGLSPGPGALPALPVPDSAFELAWAVGVAHLECHPALPELLDALVSWQDGAGLWPGSAELRVTEPDCWPGEPPRGRLYVDGRGAIATASAVLVLAEVLA